MSKSQYDSSFDTTSQGSESTSSIKPDNRSIDGFSSDASSSYGYYSIPVPFTSSSSLARSDGASTLGDTTSGGSVTVTTSGSGLKFVNTYDATCTAAYEACVVAAEKTLESYFTNNVTINVSFTESNQGNTGGALSNSWNSWTTVSYATLKAALPSSDVLPSSDPNPAGGKDWYLPEAYGRMLGLSATAPATDLTVKLNSYYNWAYTQDVTNGVIHELTEGGMGRVGGLGDQNSVWSTMDLFRYKAAGSPDYTDGRDGATTYFSSDGGNTLSTLSFNNQYSGATHVNTGDPADWAQTAVFGSTGTGETLTLAQSELDTMRALGWTTALPQDVMTASGDWQVATNWSNGSTPITPDDAFIGALSAVTAVSNGNVTVNSIGANALSTLTIGNSSTFTATNGTTLNPARTYTLASGNLGVINVNIGSALAVGSVYNNVGVTNIGVVYSTFAGSGVFALGNTVTLNGGGKLNLGQHSSVYYSTGIVNGVGLINVDNTIAGAGKINALSFDNQAGGTVDVNQTGGNPLSITSSSMKNEGVIAVDANMKLYLGTDSGTSTLTNSGSLQLGSGSQLAIAGNYTVKGSGAINSTGGSIVSDRLAATTLINQAAINFTGVGQIGDVGLYAGVNDLSFNNSNGSVIVSAATCTIDTGANVVADAGGVLEAANGGTLILNSNVTTGQLQLIGLPAPTGGTILATSNGTVIINGSVSKGISGVLSVTGQVEIDGGTVEILSTASVSVPVLFTANGGTLQLAGQSTAVNATGSNATIDLNASQVTITGGNDLIAFAGSGDVANLYNTAGNWDTVTGSGGVVTLNQALANVVGGGDIVYFNDASGDVVELYNTGSNWDTVYGSGGTVALNKAFANVIGGGDLIDVSAGDVVELYNTGSNWDTVSGSGGVVALNNAVINVDGGGNVIDFNDVSGDIVELYNTAGNWDQVNGSNGTVALNNAQANVVGGGNLITFDGSANNIAELYATKGNWDTVSGSGGLVALNNAIANVIGGGNVIDFNDASGDIVELYNTAGNWDQVNGSNGTVALNNVQANVVGGGNLITFDGSANNIVELYATNGNWDTVSGSGGVIALNSVAANVVSGGNIIDFNDASGDVVELYNTAGNWDQVNGSNGTVALNNAQVNIVGGGNSVTFDGSSNDFAELYATQGNWDQVKGSNGSVALNTAQANVTGNHDTIAMQGTSGNLLGLYGNSEAITVQPAFGQSAIIGFNSTDTMTFSASDFADWQALQGHMAQSGANTIITLDASDSITLYSVTASALTSAQFKFA